METSEIKGYGADADPNNRPGIPWKRPPHPEPGAHRPRQQESEVGVFKHQRPGQVLTPVYGTAQPPRGFAGMLRELAYRSPTHQARHWMILLVADRVDVLEHRLGKISTAAAIAGLVLLGGTAARLMRRA
jgi:hypothetical protein